jgi:CPA1 family monovalent cation:H+ antiporter
LTKELLFSVFLPGLLFEAAFHIEFREFWRNRLAIALLAVPCLAAAVGLTTVILAPVVSTLHLEQDFTWPYVLVFGVLIAAYGSFVSAEHFHFSGVIAVVVAGGR